MAVTVWLGVASNAYNTAANWDTGAVPGSGDTVVFMGEPGNPCVWNPATNGTVDDIRVMEDFKGGNASVTISAGTINLKSALFERGNFLTVSGTLVFNFSDSAYDYSNSFVKFAGSTDSVTESLSLLDNGIFDDSTSRSRTTFKFTVIGSDASGRMLLPSGTYPNVEVTAGSSGQKWSPAFNTTLQNANMDRGVEMLNLNISSNNVSLTPSGVVTVEADYSAIFKINGTFASSSTALHDWGKSTVHFYGNSTPFNLPVTGSGYGTSFTASYRSVVIEPGSTTGSHYCQIATGNVLECDKLEIASGGRLYGPNTNPGSEIHLLNRPKINGSWNFKQVADGIYRSLDAKGTLPVSQGGTGINNLASKSLLIGNGNVTMSTLGLGSANQVLTVNSAGNDIEWAAASGGGGSVRTVTVDTDGDGSADNTLGSSETLMLKKGTNITLAEAGGVVTISSADTNTQLSQEQVEDYAGALVATGGTKTGITVTYDDANGDMDFVVTQPHVAHLSLSSSVTGFASGAYTIAPLDTADVDTASAWDNTNKCYVVPRAGNYLVAYSIAIRYISSSHLAIANLYKQSGGSGTFSGSTVSRATYGRDSGEPSGGTILLNCAANDRIALYAYHNGGSGKNLMGDGTTEGLTFLSIMEIL